MKFHTQLITATLLASLFAGCSTHSSSALANRNVTDSGAIEIKNPELKQELLNGKIYHVLHFGTILFVDGKPVRYDFGNGKKFVIMPTVNKVAITKTVGYTSTFVTLVKLKMTIEQTDSRWKIHRLDLRPVTVFAGEGVRWFDGDTIIEVEHEKNIDMLPNTSLEPTADSAFSLAGSAGLAARQFGGGSAYGR